MAEKTINVKIDSDLHKLMKLETAKQDCTIAAFLEKAISESLNVSKDEDGKWIETSKA